jgi:simple sugar transport system ATP-binding protein
MTRGGHSQTAAPARAGGSRQAAAVTVAEVSKRFGATRALDTVSLVVSPGEIHGLVGRNGAGKSTLAHIIAGVLAYDSGSVAFRGRDAADVFREPMDWHQEVALVDQEGSLIPTMSVAENLYVGRYAGRGHRWVNWRAMKDETRRRLAEWDLTFDPTTLAGNLDVEQHALVEIARALSSGARTIILDEPTARLDRAQIVRLFDRVRALKAQGIAFVYISHHLIEIFELCDSVTVLRDGKQIPVGPVADLDDDALVHAIVGDATAARSEPQHRAAVAGAGAMVGPPRGTDSQGEVNHEAAYVEVRGLSIDGGAQDVSFSVRRGECVGLAGTVGSGTEDVARVIAGFHRPAVGEVLVDGRPLLFGDVAANILRGVSSVPRDRRREGIIPELGVGENITLTVMRRLGRLGLVMPRRRAAVAKEQIDSLEIVAASVNQPIVALSGGNQQKAVFGRALTSSPSVLVLVSPTAGVDVASKAALLVAVLETRTTSGVAVILVSDELDELRACDRVLVMVRGQITAEFDEGWLDEEIVAAMEGMTSGKGEAI